MHKFYKILYFLIASFLLLSGNAFGQKSQGIGTDLPNPRAVLDITVENPNTYPQGLLLPRLTTVQRNSLATVAGLPAGMAVFDSNDLKFYIWSGTWVAAGNSTITTITGTNIASVTTITGGYNINVPNISIVGINGLTVTSAGASFSVSGQNLAQWSSTTSGIFYNSGNVAIGTNSDPTQGKLVIVEDAGINPAIAISGGGVGKSVNIQFARNTISDGGIGIAGSVASFSGIANPGDMIMRAESGNLILSAKNAGGDILFATGASDTEKMRITNNGKIGINTSTPGNALEIVGYNGGAALKVNTATIGGSPYAIQALNIQSNMYTLQASNSYTGGGSNGGAAQFSVTNPENTGSNPVVDITTNSTVAGALGLRVKGVINFQDLNVSGSVLTVDGAGNLGMGIIASSSNYFTLTGNNIQTLSNSNNIQLASTAGAYMIGTNTGLRMNSVNSIYLGNFVGNLASLGSNNVFAGNYAGNSNNNGSFNVFLGDHAGFSNTDGTSNVFNGFNAGYFNTTGNYNNFYGSQAGNSNNTGSNNNFFGNAAGNLNFDGSGNNFFGYAAGGNNSSGNDNIFIGSISGINNILGSKNIAIGSKTGFLGSNLTNAIAIGSFTSVTGSNSVVIGNNITGLGINTSAPTSMLDVNGGARIRNLSVSGSALTVDGLGNLGMAAFSASQWTSTTTGIFYNANNVGIGTNSNGNYRLNVLDNTNADAVHINNLTNYASSALYAEINNNSNSGNPTAIRTYVTSNTTGDVTGVSSQVSGGSASQVMGFSTSISSPTVGIKYGLKIGINGTGPSSVGVDASVFGATNNFAIKGYTQGGYGVYAQSQGNSNINYGVYGIADGGGTATNYALFGDASNGTTNWAGYFNGGNVFIKNRLGIGTSVPGVTLHVLGGLRFESLSVTGSVLTVDGVGNVGMGIIAGGASQWTTTTTGIYTNTFVGIGNINPTNPLSVLDFFNGAGGRISAKYDITHGVVPNGNNKAIQLNYSMAGTGGTMQFSGIEVNMNGIPAVTSTSYVPAYSAIFNVSGNGNMVGFQASISGTSLLKKIGFDANVQGTGGTQNIGINVTVSGAANNYAALLNGGNVGIGTTSPSTTLDVVGSVRFENMSIAGSVLTVDGVGNVGMGIIAASPNYFTFTGSNIRTLNNTDNIQLAATTGAYMIGTNTGLRMNNTNGIFIGNGTGNTGLENLFIGSYAGNGNSSGSYNNFFGLSSGANNTNGDYNNFIGAYSGNINAGGSRNNFLGYNSGLNNSNGNDNNFFGYHSGLNNSNGSFNIFIGYLSGKGNSVGNNNIALGQNTGFLSNNLSNAIAIGYLASVTGSNSVAIGNNITSLGINTSAPTAMLDINGGARIRSLSVAGAFLTVDGLGNVGITTVIGNSQWITTTTGIYTNSVIGIGVKTFSGFEALRVNSYNGTKGFIPPYITTVQMVALTALGLSLQDQGALFWNTDLKDVSIWDGTQWQNKSNNNNNSNDYNFLWNTYGSNTVSGTSMSIAGFGSIGTFDAYGLRITTNNAQRMYISSAGGISMGQSNSLNDAFSGQIAVGSGNILTGNRNYIVGQLNTITGSAGLALGYQVHSAHLGAALIGDWSNNAPNYTQSSQNDQMTMRFDGGYRLYSDKTLGNIGLFITKTNTGINIQTPVAALQVNGDVGLGDGTNSGNKPVNIWLKNVSGSSRVAGEIVIVSTVTGAGNDDSFDITATAGNNAVVGVLYEDCTNGSSCRVAISGVVSVIADVATVRGQHVITGSIIAGRAGTTPIPNTGASIGVWLQDAIAAGSKARVLLR